MVSRFWRLWLHDDLVPGNERMYTSIGISAPVVFRIPMTENKLFDGLERVNIYKRIALHGTTFLRRGNRICVKDNRFKCSEQGRYKSSCGSIAGRKTLENVHYSFEPWNPEATTRLLSRPSRKYTFKLSRSLDRMENPASHVRKRGARNENIFVSAACRRVFPKLGTEGGNTPTRIRHGRINVNVMFHRLVWKNWLPRGANRKALCYRPSKIKNVSGWQPSAPLHHFSTKWENWAGGADKQKRQNGIKTRVRASHFDWHQFFSHSFRPLLFRKH